MDPLSMTAAIVTFVDIANRIKSCVDRFSENRRTLKDLTRHIVNELQELRILCQRQEELHSVLPIGDDPLAISLKNLHSEFKAVLECCLKFTEPQKRSHLGFIKKMLNTWLKNPKLEAEISRLRDHVSSLHRQFTYITSMRLQNIEKCLLVDQMERRTGMHQMDRLFYRFFIDSYTSGINPPPFMDDAMDAQFLRFQAQKVADLLSCVWAKRAFIPEDLDRVLDFKTGHCTRVLPPPPSSSEFPEASRIRLVATEVFQTIHLLDSTPSDISMVYGARQLLRLDAYLWELGLSNHAAVVNNWTITIYRRLASLHRKFIPCVSHALGNLIAFGSGTPEWLDICKSTIVMICKDIVDTHTDDVGSLCIAATIHRYASKLAQYGLHEYAIEVERQSLALQRKVRLLLEQSGEAQSSSESKEEFYWATYLEAICLGQLAQSLAATRQRAEARISGNGAIACTQALVGWNLYDQLRMDRLSEDIHNLLKADCSRELDSSASIDDRCSEEYYSVTSHSSVEE
ncbi:Fungal N-terminal domain-containing protein [Pleurotus pulmonarius]